LSMVTIPLGGRLPGRSSGVPGSSAGHVVGTCFALHRTGFGEPPCRHGAGGLLPHPFTLTFDVSRDPSPAVSFLCHFPSAFAAWVAPASCPAVSGLSSKRLRAPRSPGLLPQCSGGRGRIDGPERGGAMKRIAALAVFAVAVAVAAGVALGARDHHGHGSHGKVIHVMEH